ncbi:hypothetical protein D9M70_604510 [compost metagenome]
MPLGTGFISSSTICATYPGTTRPIAPRRTDSGGLDTNTWIISVPPMPSIISMPVASFQSWRVASGRASPAETLFFSEAISNLPTSAAICR